MVSRYFDEDTFTNLQLTEWCFFFRFDWFKTIVKGNGFSLLQPLIGMPSSETFQPDDQDNDEDEDSESVSPPGSPYRNSITNRSRPGSVNSRMSNRSGSQLRSRPNSGVNQQGHMTGRHGSAAAGPGARAMSRQAGGQTLTNLQRSNVVSKGVKRGVNSKICIVFISTQNLLVFSPWWYLQGGFVSW